MKRKKNTFWGTVANLILRKRFLIIGGIILLTVFFGTQWKNMRFTFTEANLLPNNHPGPSAPLPTGGRNFGSAMLLAYLLAALYCSNEMVIGHPVDDPSSFGSRIDGTLCW